MFKIQAPDRRAWQTETDAQADRREQKKKLIGQQQFHFSLSKK